MKHFTAGGTRLTRGRNCDSVHSEVVSYTFRREQFALSFEENHVCSRAAPALPFPL